MVSGGAWQRTDGLHGAAAARADVEPARVGFHWKDYRHHGKTKLMTLAPDEFIRRFLQHTLPDGFHRIRHYGLLANTRRTANLAICRRLLAAPPPIAPTPTDYRDRYHQLTGRGRTKERGTLCRQLIKNPFLDDPDGA